jgi:excinuclease ABC subunit C
LQWHLGLCPAHKPGKKIDYIKSLNVLTHFLRLYAGEKIRMEAYDISNIQGKYATGSMIVFYGMKASKSDYRKFRIRTVRGANDIAMLKEVLFRRLGHPEWPYPEFMLIDGGKAQLNAAIETVAHRLPSTALLSLAKREEEIYTEYSQKPLPIAALPESLRLNFQHIRDEAHRFAIFYYHFLHGTTDYKRPRRAPKTDRTKSSSPPKTQKA